MYAKTKEKSRAIQLRKQGKTYREILDIVHVSKSTLSLWLRDVGLSTTQKQRITAKKRASQLRGGSARRQMRVEETSRIYKEASAEVQQLSKRERLLIGVALYWAEGAKEKVGKRGQGIDFGNTDPEMIRFFLSWLDEFFSIGYKDIRFSLYIHKSKKHEVDAVEHYWRKRSGCKQLKFSYVYFKKHNPKTNRKNVADTYYGTLRVRVLRSTALQRKISGWTYGITGAPCRVV